MPKAKKLEGLYTAAELRRILSTRVGHNVPEHWLRRVTAAVPVTCIKNGKRYVYLTTPILRDGVDYSRTNGGPPVYRDSAIEILETERRRIAAKRNIQIPT